MVLRENELEACKMNESQLREILELVHDIFPLPEYEDFAGTHHIVLNKEGNVEIGVWYLNKDNMLRVRGIIFDPNEEITGEELLRIREEYFKGE